MSTQTKSKLFLLIIVILLLTNITLLFFLFNKNGGDGKKISFDKGAAAKEFLKNEIGFTDAQLQQYDTLARQHRERVKGTFDEMRKAKEQQFRELGRHSFSDSAIADAVTQSVEKQKMMELQFYNHMLEVRKICTVSQLPKFDSLFYKMWSKKPKKPEEKK